MRAEQQFILDLLSTGTKFVTASHRQSRFIQTLWQNHQLILKNNTTEISVESPISWQQADCITWDDWLLQNFEICSLKLNFEGKKAPKILSSLEQRWLWEFNLKQLNEANIGFDEKPITQQHSLLSSLLQAWSLYLQWRLNYSEEALSAFNFTEETRLFDQLREQFELVCRQNNWISKESLIDFVGDNQTLWQDENNSTLCFYGFDDWTPQQQNFLDSLSAVKFQDFSRLKTSIVTNTAKQHLHPCASKYAEWQQAAKWARLRIESHPDEEIAIVIPSLSTDRAQILRIFQQQFQPQLQIQAESNVASGFNISVGENVNQQAIVQSARNWFSLIGGGMGEEWLKAISDPFCLAATDERWARASLSKQMGLLKQKFYSVQIVQQIITQKDIIPVAKLTQILQLLIETEITADANKTTGDWCLFLEKFLNDLGWPGDTKLSSQTYQAMHQWLANFRQLSALDNFCGEQSLSEFLSLLDQQMNTNKFQPQTPNARVQVLGILEVIGLNFDSIWLTGCQDNVFPAPLNASPWLPIKIQQDNLMPGASAIREQQFATNLFVGMQISCDQIHYSYALTEADSELKQCAFIEHLFENGQQQLPPVAAEELPDYWLEQSSQGVDSVSNWRDIQGELLSSDKVKSGVGILKYQASCPFKAYAEFRLSAGASKLSTIGIDPMQRGNWVHDVLEMVWKRLATQQALLELSQSEQLQLVTNCATEVIFKPSKKNSRSQANENFNLDSPLVNLEFERTVALVMSWLEIDRNRSQFLSVAVEQSQEISVAQLSFMVRADRIDEIAGGQKIIIDYKTGTTSTSSWFNERITEPQLPLYGLIFTDKLAAIAIAELTPKKTKLKGFAAEEIKIKGLKSLQEWPDLIQQWQVNLETVALEYAQGYAAVDPDKNACTYCDYSHLCRRDAYFISDESSSQRVTEE